MDAYLQLSPADQAAACNEAGRRLSLLPGSIEKDFWVCWTLRELFALPGIGEHLTFKGGTSLSKCYGLIKRFSEDIDLVIDRTSFDIKPPDEVGIGSNERERRLESLKAASRNYIHAVLKPAVESFLRAKLPAGRVWSLIDQDAPDGGIELLFTYPTVLGAQAGLNPVVKIEPGARSDIEPNSSPEIQPEPVCRAHRRAGAHFLGKGDAPARGELWQPVAVAKTRLGAALLRPLLPYQFWCRQKGKRRRSALQCSSRPPPRILPQGSGDSRRPQTRKFPTHASGRAS